MYSGRFKAPKEEKGPLEFPHISPLSLTSLMVPDGRSLTEILTAETKEELIVVLTLMRPLFLQCSFGLLD